MSDGRRQKTVSTPPVLRAERGAEIQNPSNLSLKSGFSLHAKKNKKGGRKSKFDAGQTGRRGAGVLGTLDATRCLV